MTTTLAAIVVGTTLGIGLMQLVVPPPHRGLASALRTKSASLLAEAGLSSVRPWQLVTCSVVAGVSVAVAALGISQAMSISLAFGLLGAYTPVGAVAHRRRQRRTQLRALWPDVIDNLASAVRAGLSLPEALAQLAQRGPEALRPAFARFADEYRVSGRFGVGLDLLKADLADPVGDRVVEALRLAREVGGHDLGTLLRTLSTFLRDDLRTRGEIRSRQSWTVNAARLAVAAPWILLALLSLRPQAVAAYDTTAGLVVLGVGAGVSFIAYRLMLRIARLPVEQRVLP